MYSYIHDPETGGLLLTSSPTKVSREPRPVYAPELDMLGLNEHWKYSTQTDAPYMWAEASAYIYRGVKVAELHGGDLYHAPEVEITPEGEKISELVPVDIEAMCRKNDELLNIIERNTVRKITADYEKYSGRADIFYVAFSGGKDSSDYGLFRGGRKTGRELHGGGTPEEILTPVCVLEYAPKSNAHRKPATLRREFEDAFRS